MTDIPGLDIFGSGIMDMLSLNYHTCGGSGGRNCGCGGACASGDPLALKDVDGELMDDDDDDKSYIVDQSKTRRRVSGEWCECTTCAAWTDFVDLTIGGWCRADGNIFSPDSMRVVECGKKCPADPGDPDVETCVAASEVARKGGDANVCSKATCGESSDSGYGGVMRACTPKWKPCPRGWTISDFGDAFKCNTKVKQNDICHELKLCNKVVAGFAGCACVTWDTSKSTEYFPDLKDKMPNFPGWNTTDPAHDPRLPSTRRVSTGRGMAGGDEQCVPCDANDGGWNWEGPRYGPVHVY